MGKQNIAPTKTNLLKLRQEYKFASLGYELLDQKRNILTLELLGMIDRAVNLQEQLDKLLASAYRELEEAVLQMGKLKVLNLSNAVNLKVEINLKQRRVMGVRLPVVETEFAENPPYFSPMSTSYRIDTVMNQFKAVLKLMGQFGELKISIVRLAQEVRKTIRKVNALEKIAIPGLKDNVAYIQNRLEENERDMFVLMKMVKQRLETRTAKKEE